MTWFHEGGFNEERRSHGYTTPRPCVCGVHAGGSGDVLSGPAFIPQVARFLVCGGLHLR